MNPTRRMRNTLVLAAMLIAALPAAAQSDVSIVLDQFGVGNAFRPGDSCGIRLKLTSSLTEATPVWVQWEAPNADGDIAENGRSLTLTPGVPALVWLYALLPPDADTTSVWTVRVFEERDGQRQRELGGVRIDPRMCNAQKVDLDRGMIAVVGNKHLGLADYNIPGERLNRPLGAHEDTRIIFGLSPTSLPDRWEGLKPYEAIAWGGDRDAPSDLSLDQANALREYVSRGGHFIISLPAEGPQWGLGARGQHLLEDLLPESAPHRVAAVSLETLLPILSKADTVRGNVETTIRVFKDLKGDFDATDHSTRFFEPLIALNDGRVVVIRRNYGHGWVTLIGIDVANGQLISQGLPQADAFWNRILGRRCDTPTYDEQIKIRDGHRLSRMPGRDLNLGSGKLFMDLTDFPAEAGLGLLLALVLFAMYWLLAGPLGFALLKQYKQTRHAWVVFAACAGLFTAVAWGTVGLLPKQLSVRHVTYLDRIARPPAESSREANDPQLSRAVSFFAVRLPGYRPTPITIESTPGQRDLLASWSPPPMSDQKFPNVDRYKVDVGRNPAKFSIPARATATRLYAHWTGGLDSHWGGMISYDPEYPVQVVNGELRGRIINDLPGELINYTLIWVKSNRPRRLTYDSNREGGQQPWVSESQSGIMLNAGDSWRWDANNNPLTPGGSLDLASFTKAQGTPLSIMIERRYIDGYKQSDVAALTTAHVSETDRRNYMEMLSLFQMMKPPTYLKGPDAKQDPDTVTMHRELGRELDLSTWLTRPCLILIGYLENSECPVPLRLNNDDGPPPSDGVTIVRWIYPLSLDEKEAFSEVFEEEEP
jgi:hypothetical protein